MLTEGVRVLSYFFPINMVNTYSVTSSEEFDKLDCYLTRMRISGSLFSHVSFCRFYFSDASISVNGKHRLFIELNVFCSRETAC